MIKKWNKIDKSEYLFLVDNQEVGTIRFFFNSFKRNASIEFNENQYTITRSGFWKNTVEITDKNGTLIAKIYSNKWYSNKSTIEYKEIKYQLVIRNNPLAEFVVVDTAKELLAYGLNSNQGKVNVKINSSSNSTDYLLDFILWYLFVPVAIENMEDEFTFLMLSTA